MAIASFGQESLEIFYRTGTRPRRAGWTFLHKIVLRKLDMIHYASRLEDLRSPPGNRLEQLRGDLAGRHSIRVNQQWRLVFRWTEQGAAELQIVDYH